MNDSAIQTKTVLEQAKTGTLSVLDFETGAAFGALVNVATDRAGLPIFLFSTLARHTKCILADPRASLLVAELPVEGDPLTGFRATITGRMEMVKDDVRGIYVAKHPYAELYAGFGDFSFWRLRPEVVYVVAGFGRIHSFAAKDVFV
jgi:putative heme iron utilization protein